MALLTTNLAQMRGRIAAFRKGLDPSLIDGWINDRLQVIEDQRRWAGLTKTFILSIPNQYITGTVSATVGSNVITGTTTAWPTNDVVNTTIPLAINDLGYQEITPASMTGINSDSLLYVDAAGTPEIVAVVRTTPQTFTAKFTQFHNANATVWMSSLASRQFRMGEQYPVFTVQAVTSATSLILDTAWGGTTNLTNVTYQILLIYVTLALDLKEVQNMVDQSSGWPVRLHVSKGEIDWRDPQSAAIELGGVLNLVDLGVDQSGNMLYAIWPPITSAHQFQGVYYSQWPPMVRDNDILPPFLNPSVLYYGAMADAFAFKAGDSDPYHSLEVAMKFEAMFAAALEAAKNDDERRIVRDYTFDYEGTSGSLGADFWRSHDPDVMNWAM